VNDDDDIVWGAKAIAEVINRDLRATFHLLESGALPANKVLGRWCGSRARLRAFVTGEAA
jgi:hypothetical protein